MHKVNLQHCGNTQIEEVNLSHNPITNFSLLPKLPMFEHTRKLTLYDLQYPEEVFPDQIELHCLLNMKHLTTLEISMKEIPESVMEGHSLSLVKFVSALRNTPELQVLRFYDGNIDSQNALDLFKLLEHNTSMEELDLSENSQLAEGDSEGVGCAIEKMLTVNRTLKVLNLSKWKLNTAVPISIFRSLQHNSSLEELLLSENSQLAEGNSESVGRAIERMLTVNRALKVLN